MYSYHMIQPFCSLLFTQMNWKTYAHAKKLHMDIYISFIHNWQNSKTTKMFSLGRWIKCGTSKQWNITMLKRNELSSHDKTWRNLKCILLSERTQSAKATHCMIPTKWHSGNGKTMKTVKRSVAPRGVVGDRWLGRTQRIVRVVKLFCMILQWWIHVTVHLSKPTECTPRTSPNINHGL